MGAGAGADAREIADDGECGGVGVAARRPTAPRASARAMPVTCRRIISVPRDRFAVESSTRSVAAGSVQDPRARA